MSMAVSSGKTHRSEGLVDAIETAETQPDATPARPAGSRRQFGRCVSAEKNGGPGVTRTPGTQFRKLLLYPPELRGHADLRDTPARF
jgi:hypothetical protein